MSVTEEKTDNRKLIPFVPEGDFYFAKGVESFRKSKFDMALKWLTKAIEMKPEDPMYKCQKSVVYTEIGSYEQANELLKSVLNTCGERYPDCYYLIANNHAHLGLLNDAQKYAQTYLEVDPEGAFAAETKTLLDMLDIEETDGEWAMDEDELLILQETIFYHMEYQEWDEAMPLLNEMMSLYPEYALPKHDYALVLFYSGFEQKAIDMEEDLLAQMPGNLSSIMNLAVFYHQQHSDAYYHYSQGLLYVHPIHEQQKLRLAVTLAKIGFVHEAYLRFRALIKSHINSPSYYRWYTRSAYMLDKVDEADAIWAEGCRLHPQLKTETSPKQPI